MEKFIKLEIYVPTSHAEVVKDAIFRAGAGRIGNYDCCCWQTAGTGQFRPLSGSNPFLGSENKVELVEELKIEVICPAEIIKEIIVAMRTAHPYETPAFQYWPVSTE